MGTATTFAELIAADSSEKVFLAEIKVSQHVTGWAKTDGKTNVYQVTWGSDSITLVDGTTDTISKTAVDVKENGTSYTAKTSTADVDGTASTYWHDTANGVLYIHTSTDAAPSGFTITAYFWLYFATKGLSLNGIYYEPVLAENSIPRISQQVQSLRYGIVTVSSGGIILNNANGFFDQISKKYIWANGILKLLLGGDALPYAQYTALFQGKVQSPRFTNLEFSLDIKSISYDLLRSLPANVFTTATYANLDPKAVGRSIPLYYGSYSAAQAPIVTCINTAYAASTYQFKICDTTYHEIKSITQVYVDYGDGVGWQTIAHANESLSAATFTINTASFVVGTSQVKVAFEGYHSGSVLYEGAPEIAEDLLTTWCGLSSSDLDSTSFTASKAASSCALNVPIEVVTSALSIIEQICRSDLAYFSDSGSGTLRYTTWTPTIALASTEDLGKTDIWDVQFSDDLDSLYYKAKIGYSYLCSDDEYLYTTSSDDASRYKYGKAEILEIDTYLRGSADAGYLAKRMNLLTKDLLTLVTFGMSIAEIDKLIADKFLLTLERSPYETAGGQDSWPYEIIAKEISAYPVQITFTARDMNSFARGIGFWTAADAPTWLLATAVQKTSSGYWSDSNGYADPSAVPDGASLNCSLWW